MFGKWFAAAALAIGFCAAAAAGDCVRVDLNYYSKGTLKLDSEQLPAGVTVTGPHNYKQPKFAKFCFYQIVIDLEKAREFDLTFTVTSVGGTIIPSASPFRRPEDKKKPRVKCVEFEFCDEPSPFAPCVLTKWQRMIGNETINFRVGDKVMVKAKFQGMTK